MCDRVEGKVGARETAIGLMPEGDDLTLDGLDIPAEDWEALLAVDKEGYKVTLADMKAYLAKFGNKLPAKISEQVDALEARLNA